MPLFRRTLIPTYRYSDTVGITGFRNYGTARYSDKWMKICRNIGTLLSEYRHGSVGISAHFCRNIGTFLSKYWHIFVVTIRFCRYEINMEKY